MIGKQQYYNEYGMRHRSRFDLMNCSCGKWGDNKSKLCSHLITSLDYVVRNSKFLDSTWNDGRPNPIRHTFEVFMVDQISRKLDNILDELRTNGSKDEEKMMGDFVSKVVKSNSEPNLLLAFCCLRYPHSTKYLRNCRPDSCLQNFSSGTENLLYLNCNERTSL